MISKKFTRSLTVLSVALITPVFTWILLKSLANNSFSAFDPDPWIQSLVTSPHNFYLNDEANPWIHIQIKNSELLFVTTNGELEPITHLPVFKADHLVFLVDGQGPSAAKTFYDFLQSNHYTEKSLVLSASDGFLKDVRYYNANTKLSCGQAYLIRFRMLNDLGLANLMTINMSGALVDPSIFSDNIVELTLALHQRHVPVFTFPSTTTEAQKVSANMLLPRRTE